MSNQEHAVLTTQANEASETAQLLQSASAQALTEADLSTLTQQWRQDKNKLVNGLWKEVVQTEREFHAHRRTFIQQRLTAPHETPEAYARLTVLQTRLAHLVGRLEALQGMQKAALSEMQQQMESSGACCACK